MSVQFGVWNTDGRPVGHGPLDESNRILAPFATDHGGRYSKDGISILHRAFHTTRESRDETQPHVGSSGTVITWDGRLDNRAEWIQQFRTTLTIDSADVSIVSAAYERWGAGCFSKLIGDWAVSIWNPGQRSLILAKDPIGVRSLYYSIRGRQVVWSSALDPLVLLAEETLELDEEYIAGWLSRFPAAHLTPYAGIHSVPPSCFVRLERKKQTTHRYWDFDPDNRIRYRTDAEYEEHFRAAFAESVRRRLRSDAPVLAELSGGMDSCSIVCVADNLLAEGAAVTPRLDTLSYYDDSEPSWNERPYFTKVEEQRRRTGCHINVGSHQPFRFELDNPAFSATPGTPGTRVSEAKQQFAACLLAQENRVVLSGIGGDEFTGGVPTPAPELMDLLASARLAMLAKQLKSWALQKRRPWFHLLWDAAREFFPPAMVGIPEHMRPAPWLSPNIVRRHRAALTGYPSRVKLDGPTPSFQLNIHTLETLRRQLGSSAAPAVPPHEKRYPFLDRDFLEFMFAVPREQILRPGQRRSLMRRSLAGIVPAEILERKRKAFVVRSALLAISAECASLTERSSQMISVSVGIIGARAFREAIERARCGQETQMVALLRTLEIESWLQGLERRRKAEDVRPVIELDFAVHPGRRVKVEQHDRRISAS